MTGVEMMDLRHSCWQIMTIYLKTSAIVHEIQKTNIEICLEYLELAKDGYLK